MKFKDLTALIICFLFLFSSCAPRTERAGESGPYTPSLAVSAPEGVPSDDGFSLESMAASELPAPEDSPPDTGEQSPVIPADGDAGQSAPDVSAVALSAESGNSGDTSDGDEDVDLSIPAVFNITRPAEKLTTTYAAYFITGTSDPASPVYFEDKEIERQGTKGVFGVLVELDMGTNAFTFSQGEKTSTVTIIRKEEAKTTPIDEILADSMFPAIHGGVKAGESIPVRCIAPAGAMVSASFGGISAELEQIAEAKTGIPAVFTGELPVGMEYDENKTTKAGKITYTLKWNNEEKEFTSAGDMYVAGKNSAIAIEVTSYAGFVYPDTTKPHYFKEKIKKSATDYVVWQNNQYFELKSGGYISTEMAKIIQGTVDIENIVTKTVALSGGKSEEYAFTTGSLPAYYSRISEGVFYFTLYNTTGAQSPDISMSELFSDVDIVPKNGNVTYGFKIENPGRFWGYNVSYSDGAVRLKFKYAPKLSSDAARPFEGVTILLDPGHGGTDNGANGLPGSTGPAEAAINLATAYAVRDKLESLGATVAMTRTMNSYVHLDKRLQLIEEYDADVFLSIHQNSVREDADANKVSGMEIYYHSDFSKTFSEDMMTGLQSVLDRDNRFVRQSYYRVTLMPYCPAALLELGFMSNPLEYEKLTDKMQIAKVADAVADGLKTALN